MDGLPPGSSPQLLQTLGRRRTTPTPPPIQESQPTRVQATQAPNLEDLNGKLLSDSCVRGAADPKVLSENGVRVDLLRRLRGLLHLRGLGGRQLVFLISCTTVASSNFLSAASVCTVSGVSSTTLLTWTSLPQDK